MSRAGNFAGMLLMILAVPSWSAEDFLLTFDEYRSVENQAITAEVLPPKLPMKLPERAPEHRMEVVVRVGQPFRVRTLDGNREIVLSGVLKSVEQHTVSINFTRHQADLPEPRLLADGVTPAPKRTTSISSTITGELGTTHPLGESVISWSDTLGSNTERVIHTLSVTRWKLAEDE